MEAGLLFYRARFYQPGSGTFTQEDPKEDTRLPRLRTRVGRTAYGYVNSAPLLNADPSGLSSRPVDWTSIARHMEACGRRMAAYAENQADAMASAPGFPGGWDGRNNGPGNAFKHCLWSCLMNQNCGGAAAFLGGWGHEIVHNRFFPLSESMMDAFNNAAGRSCTDCVDCQNCCLSKLRVGELQTFPHL